MGKGKKHAEEFDFSSTDILTYIWEKRIPLILISVFGAILSLIISFTITPMFKSTVIMFPTTGSSVSKELISDSYSGRSNIYEIGTEVQAEQLLQILNSADIRNRITEKYNLMEHYDIDPKSNYPNTKLQARFKKNIKFKLTEYMSVVIEVMDKDPQLAADIANDIAVFTDTVHTKMLRERSYEAFLLVQKEYNELTASLKQISDSLDYIRKMGVNNYQSQAERYYEAYGKALIEGNKSTIDVIEQKLNTISKYGGAYVSLSYLQQHELARYSRIKQKYAEARLELEQSLPYTFIVDKAFKAEKKSYPKKSIIIIVSTIFSFLFGLILLIIYDQLKQKSQA